MTDFAIVVSRPQVKELLEMFDKYGSIAVWHSAYLPEPALTWITPGENTERPHWKAESEPAVIIRDEDKHLVGVDTLKEVKRVKVAVRLSSNGLSFKLTDASTKRLRNALEKAGPRSSYHFDYATKEAVILGAVGDRVPLSSLHV